MAWNRRFWRVVLAACASLAARAELRAHDPQFGVGTLTRIVFKEDRALLTFDLSYKGIWAQAEMITADLDKSSAIEEAEAAAYVERQWQAKIAPRLKVKLDGKELTLEKITQRHDGLVGEIYGVPFSLFYELEATFPGGNLEPGSTHTFEIADSVVKDETPALPIFNVPYQGHGAKEGSFQKKYIEPVETLLDAATLSERLDGPRLVLELSFGGPLAALPSAPSSNSSTPRREPAAADAGAASGEGIDTALSRYRELSLWEMFLYVLLAIGYGAGHALAPGHGKSMVAAYLIGTKGRVRDAVILGLTTTVTHTGSVFLFGLAIFAAVRAGTQASAAALQNMVVVGAQMVAGLLLLGMGLILFFRRVRGIGDGHHHGHHHGHGHGHGHGHAHSHAHADDHAITDGPPHDHDHGHTHDSEPSSHSPGLLQGGAPRLRDLLTIGFTGGLVPCPAGLTVILLGMTQPDRLVFGLVLLLFFSIGLGAVLVAIGVLLITGRALARPKLIEHRLFKALPAISALFVAGLGAYFCIRTYSTGKTPLAALLRMAADWLE